VICGVERGSDYKEPAVAKPHRKVFDEDDCSTMNQRELAGR
jgi:hypothetical protein